jgi:(R,R)-butanediol dehydrogenase/meso-butanediol dehydrogenase/diacetyl reductase
VRALSWTGGQDVAVVDVPEPVAAEGQVLVKVAYTGLCGTDLHICAGEHPRAKPGQVIGHEIVGAITAPVGDLPAGSTVVVDPLLACGKCATCRADRPHTCANLRLVGIDVPGGAAPLVAVDTDRLVPAAGSVDNRRLAFAEPLAVAVRAVRRARLQLGETVVVIGGGPIGGAVAVCAARAGASNVVVAEPSPERRAFIEALGFPTAPRATGLNADVVFDAAAHPSVAPDLTTVPTPGGRVVLVGVYGDPVPVDLRAATFKELTVVGTRVYSREDIRVATRMIAEATFDPTPFLTATVSLDDAPLAIAELRHGHGVKVLVEPTS